MRVSRHEEQVDAAVNAEVTCWRERVKAAEERAVTAEANQQSIARNQGVLLDQYRQVISRNRALGEQLEATQVANGFDRAGAQRTANRIKRLREATAMARAEARMEKRRADGLQQRLDDAVGLGSSRPMDSARWQPANAQPKPDKPTAEEATP
jgi:hypothetical protein